MSCTVRSFVLGTLAAFATVVVGSVHAGCNSDARDYFVVQYDAGSDASEAGSSDAEAEVDPTLGGPCSEDVQCDDRVPCTVDRCDKELSRCRNTPDDTQCADAEYCNGRERCVLRQGCVAGPVVTCQDDDPCTIDRCVESTKACEHLARDSDSDGDPDDHCVAKKDCDDTDPTVSSTQSEICDNLKDDNCNGIIDAEPCSSPTNDVCGTARTITAPGTYLLTSVGAKKDYATTCSIPSPAAGRDIVVAIMVPAGGGAKDVLVRAETSSPANAVAVALQADCGEAASELGCGYVPQASDARAIARAVDPGASGKTVHAIITTQKESAVDVKVDLLPASTRPPNETCAAPLPVTVEQPFTVSLVDPTKDLSSDCQEAKTGELTYQFSLAEPRDVRIFASTLFGSGKPVISLREASCTDERRCRAGSTPPVFARNLPAGTHVFSVAGTAQIDASVVVKTYPPTTAPANQTCATAPALVPNTVFAVDLANQEDAIKNGCLPGGPAAAYKLDLDEPSDVLVVGRFASGELGAVSLSGPDCTTADRLACSVGGSPQRVARRTLPAGSYRVVIADATGLPAELMVLVRTTVPPVTVTSDGCVAPQVIPEAGGFFTGDTTGATADFNAGCDAPGQPIGGAKDQLLRLDLAQKRHVVFDMIGSTLLTILDVRKGDSCPGAELPNACDAGPVSNRSFLDRTFDPGTHWIQVDGFAGSSGPWNLDVRVLPP